MLAWQSGSDVPIVCFKVKVCSELGFGTGPTIPRLCAVQHDPVMGKLDRYLAFTSSCLDVLYVFVGGRGPGVEIHEVCHSLG